MKATLAVLCVLLLVVGASAQDFAVDKKAAILDASFSFSSASGDLYENAAGDGQTAFSLAGTYNYFLAKNIFLGLGLGYQSFGWGDYSSSSLAIGPQVGYAMGKAESKVFPYGALGFRYLTSSVDPGTDKLTITGTDISFEVGVIIPVKEHIGFTPLLSYHAQSKKADVEGAESASGSVILLGFGISGLLY